MSITTVLLDLDGTLLPMDQEEFTRGYFELLAEKMSACGYEKKKLVDAVWNQPISKGQLRAVIKLHQKS